MTQVKTQTAPTVFIDDVKEYVFITIPRGFRCTKEMLRSFHETAGNLGYSIKFVEAA